jgi:dihydroxyacetone kinase DhaKLM complex PTS-EIIA-like component DhaM
MCEFDIIKAKDGSKIAEEILSLAYTDNNALILKDILGSGLKLDSALILDVNTMSQKCTVMEHPLIKDFLKLMIDINDNKINSEEISEFQEKLEQLKENL